MGKVFLVNKLDTIINLQIPKQRILISSLEFGVNFRLQMYHLKTLEILGQVLSIQEQSVFICLGIVSFLSSGNFSHVLHTGLSTQAFMLMCGHLLASWNQQTFTSLLQHTY